MLGGHNSRIFQSKPSEKFDCPLCFETLKDPLQCTNGHLFCKTCILSVLEKRNRCPVCDTCISVSLLSKSLFVQQCIGKLTTLCVSRDSEIFFQSPEVSTAVETCDWIGPLHARNQHYETECQYFPTKCDIIGCEVQLLRKYVVEHKVACLFAQQKCKLCNKIYQRHTMVTHNDSCDDRPVLCPRNCSAILSFSQVAAHLQNDCPNQKATSSYAELSELSIDGDGRKAQQSVTTVSKSSKKNAKKAARRKNPNTTEDITDSSVQAAEHSINADILDRLMNKVLCTEDISGEDNSSTGTKTVNELEQYAFEIKRLLDLCPASELDRQLTTLCVSGKNSVSSRIRKDNLKWPFAVAQTFGKAIGYPFSVWICQKYDKVVELRYLLDRLTDISEDRTMLKNFSGFVFTEWLRRRDYQASVEITVSGSYDSAADGKYRCSVSLSIASFEKDDKSTAHTIAVHGSENYSCWCLCLPIPNDSLPGEPSFGKLRWFQLYNQDTTPYSAIPSETMPWRCIKSPEQPVHPNDNKMKISIARIYV